MSWRAEQALRQSQRVEAVGQLTGGIAHDFNNLCRDRRQPGAPDKRLSEGRLGDVERHIRSAQGATRRAASLTQRLLAFARHRRLIRPTGEQADFGMGTCTPDRRFDVEVEVIGDSGLDDDDRPS